jgi:hypothetical protein
MALYITLAFVLAAAVWTVCHRPCIDDFGQADPAKDKLRESIALDIRAASQYCYWYLALLGVSATIVASASNRELYKSVISWQHLWPFCVAFAAASLALIFIPAGYGSDRFNRLRVVWFRSIICEQVVVIFTCYGAWEVFKVLAAS